MCGTGAAFVRGAAGIDGPPAVTGAGLGAHVGHKEATLYRLDMTPAEGPGGRSSRGREWVRSRAPEPDLVCGGKKRGFLPGEVAAPEIGVPCHEAVTAAVERGVRGREGSDSVGLC